MNNSGSGGISDSWWSIKKRIPQLFFSFLVLAITSVEAIPTPSSSSSSPSPSSSPSSTSKSSKSQNVAVILVCAAVGVLIVVVVILSLRKLRKRSAADLPHISKNGVTGVNAASADLQSELEVTEGVFRDSISLATISSTFSSARLHSLSSMHHSTISSLSSARLHSLSSTRRSSSMRRYSSPPVRGPLRYFSSLSSTRRFSSYTPYTQTSEPAPPSSVSTSPKTSPLEEMSDIASLGVNEDTPSHSLLSVSSCAASESSPAYNEVLKDAPPPPYKKYME